MSRSTISNSPAWSRTTVAILQTSSSRAYSRVITMALTMVALLILVLPVRSLAAADTDDDGISDSTDNCPLVANSDQHDAVSAFIVANTHTRYEYTLFTGAHAGWKIWIPSDTAKAKLYAGDTLLQAGGTISPQENVTIYDQLNGADYKWVDHGGKKQERLWVNYIGQLDGPLTLVLSNDSDGNGDKCSPNLGIDFDGVPDGADNCPFDYNPNQENTFGTSSGDACETDTHLTSNTNPTRPDWIYQATATLYEHPNYTGKSERIWVSDSDLNGNYIGPHTVSSLTVGRDTEVVLHSTKDYLGTSETFFGDDPDLTPNSIGDNNTVSIKIGADPPIRAFKEEFGVDFWSKSKGHVGHILWSQMSNLVATGAGNKISMSHDYASNIKSISVIYDGNADYTVVTTNLDDTTGETAYFHYESASGYGSEEQIAGTYVTTQSDTPATTDQGSYRHTSTGQSWDGYLKPGVREIFLAVYTTEAAAKAAWEQQAKVAA